MPSKAQFLKAFQHFPVFQVKNEAFIDHLGVEPCQTLWGGSEAAMTTVPSHQQWFSFPQVTSTVPTSCDSHNPQFSRKYVISISKTRKLRINDLSFPRSHIQKRQSCYLTGFSDFKSSSLPIHTIWHTCGN